MILSDRHLSKEIYPSFPRGKRDAGFTLVEIMVAVAVLALLVVMTAQLTSNATNMVTSSDKLLDAQGEAELVFNRMATDISGMLRRPDVDCFFVKNNSSDGNTVNDAFYFYSQSTGFVTGGQGPASPISLIGYRIANRASPTTLAPNGVLERVGINMVYDTNGNNSQTGTVMRYLTYPTPLSINASALPRALSTIAGGLGNDGNPADAPTNGNEIGNSPTWDNPSYVSSNQAVLSSRVFRLEFCFLMNNGTYFVPTTPGAQPWSNVQYQADMLNIRTNAVSMVVTIAILDQKSQLIVPQSTPNVPNFAQAMAALADGATPAVASTWLNTLDASLASPSTCVATLGMPIAAASQIRIYQRNFQLMP